MNGLVFALLTGITFTLATSNHNRQTSSNYNFGYQVFDATKGLDFGHAESRQLDRVDGMYFVLLPDGRRQTVRYRADERGYFPVITYSETNSFKTPEKRKVKQHLNTASIDSFNYKNKKTAGYVSQNRFDDEVSNVDFGNSQWKTEQTNSGPFTKKKFVENNDNNNFLRREFTLPKFKPNYARNAPLKQSTTMRKSRNRKMVLKNNTFKNSKLKKSFTKPIFQAHKPNPQLKVTRYYNENRPPEINIYTTRKPNMHQSQSHPESLHKLSNFYIKPLNLPPKRSSSYISYESKFYIPQKGIYKTKNNKLSGYFKPQSGPQVPTQKSKNFESLKNNEERLNKVYYKPSLHSKNPDEAVVPKVVPVIYPVEGDIIISKEESFFQENDEENINQITLGDYWDDDYL